MAIILRKSICILFLWKSICILFFISHVGKELMVYKFFEQTICFQIWLHRGNRPPGMLSIWMACEARRSKTTHGDGGVVIAAEPWREEILYFEEI